MEKPSLDTAKAGAMRFNTDSNQMEIYDGNQWTGILATSPEQQTGGTRGVNAGGEAPGDRDEIQFINISTTGNAQDFGNLADGRRYLAATSSRVTGLFMGGFDSPSFSNMIQKITISSTGNAVDTGGDLSSSKHFGVGASNGTRGIYAGGNVPGPNTNIIEFVTISSVGDAVDFGDATISANAVLGTLSNGHGGL